MLLCLLLSLTACKNAPPKSAPQIIQEPLPASLTAGTDVPATPEPMTYGSLAPWSDALLDALDTCNADKAAIRELEQRRIARGIK
ncbi:Rz1-like lysis system protein LysC [Serratia plymuthica]|uniref:Rz1-like lysis system protein LysC n=1 Tax=Serratia plymuthica TaxID=82996 RepID=UPI000564878B